MIKTIESIVNAEEIIIEENILLLNLRFNHESFFVASFAKPSLK